MSDARPGPRRVLLTGDDFYASLAMVRALRAGGYSPVLAAAERDTYAGRSRAVDAVVRVPSADESPGRFAAAVAAAATEQGVSAVLPGNETALIVLARHRGSLPVPLGAPPTTVVDLATDKARVLQLAAGHGFEAPPSTSGRPAELRARADSFSYPAILKPPRTILRLDDDRLTCLNVSRIDSPDAMRTALAPLPDLEWVVQPYVRGQLGAVAGVAWEGSVYGSVHQVARRIWPRDAGYSCYAETIPRDPRLDEQVAGLVRSLRWSGIFQLQMLRRPGASRLLIDFNPRPYGSLWLAVHAGANLPAAWAELVHGVAPAPIRYRVGARYRLEHHDLYAIASMFRDGDVRPALSALVPRPGTGHAVFSWRDPKPVIAAANKLRRRRM